MKYTYHSFTCNYSHSEAVALTSDDCWSVFSGCIMAGQLGLCVNLMMTSLSGVAIAKW